MSIPPFIDFPLLRSIYERQDTLLSGQRHITSLLQTILTRSNTMSESLTGIQADLNTLSDDNKTLAAALTTIAQNIATLVANAAGGATPEQLAALKTRADQVLADANANTSAATTIAAPPAP